MRVTQHVSLRVRSPRDARLRGGPGQAWHEDPTSASCHSPAADRLRSRPEAAQLQRGACAWGSIAHASG